MSTHPGRLPVVPGVEDLQPVGRGGHSVVYRGRQVALDRQVAVKVVAAPGTPGQEAERWQREVSAMGRLSNHPNILTPYSGGTTEDGSPYILMPYVPAGSLGDRLRSSGPLPPDDVAAIGAKLASALATAHAAGVLHRDVKPDNVLVSPYGEPQLTDFGIARLIDATTTATGTIHATIAYAAPEVLSGRPATEAADVYGLAATLFACLVGAAPFPSGEHDSIVSLVTRIATQPPPDLREAGVPAELATVIASGLAKEPEERFGGSPAAFGEALEAVAGHRHRSGQDEAPTISVAAVAPTAASTAASTPPPAAEATGVYRPAPSPVAEPSGRYRPPPRPVARTGPPRASRSRPGAALLGVAAVVLLGVLALGALALRGGDGDGDGEAVTSSSSSSSPTSPSSTSPSTETSAAPETTSSPPTTSSSAGSATAAGAAEAYFDAIAAGDLETSYGLLTPEFQAAQSFEDYEGFWSSQQPVTVTGPVRADEDSGTAVVPISAGGSARDFSLTLVPAGADGTWLVDGPRPG